MTVVVLVILYLTLWLKNWCVSFIPLHWKWRKYITKLFSGPLSSRYCPLVGELMKAELHRGVTAYLFESTLDDAFTYI